jgi:hypothetical protein
MSAVNDWNKLWTLYDSDPTTFQQDIKPLVLLGCDSLPVSGELLRRK